MKNLSLQFIILVTGILLLVIKFVAWWLTSSNAILTDASESIVNVVAGAFALYSLWLSQKPRDLDHPYGHGKIEYISAGIEGALITVAGLTMIGKASWNFFYPVELTHLDTGIILAGFSGLVNFVMGWMLVKRSEKKNNLIMNASGKHLLSDALSSAGMIAGLLVILFTDMFWLDNVIAVTFGLLIIYMGIKLVRSSLKGVMDESDEKLLKQIISSLDKNRQPQWIDLHNVRVIKYGETLHVDCHVTLPWYISLKEAHDEVEAIEQAVNKESEMNVEFFIHSDPCIPSSCSVCQLTQCHHRKQAFKQRIEWNISTALQNLKHSA